MAKPMIAIVGRPNVGKSMLFNKLIGRRLSIVEDTPGVTRDRIYGESDWCGRKFTLVDTGGIEPNTDNEILTFMREQAQIAIDNATVIVLVVDIKTGMTAADQEVANMLQRSKKPIVLAVNKMDSTGTVDPEFYEFYNLGLGDPIAVSAVHGHGTGDLLDACMKYFPPEDESEEDDDVIQVAIIGKPNVGKSSLTNRILGQERVIVSNVVDDFPATPSTPTSKTNPASITLSTPPACAKSPKWTTPSKNTASSAPPWPSSAATCASSSSTPTTASPSRTPRSPVLPTRRAKPASSW